VPGAIGRGTSLDARRRSDTSVVTKYGKQTACLHRLPGIDISIPANPHRPPPPPLPPAVVCRYWCVLEAPPVPHIEERHPVAALYGAEPIVVSVSLDGGPAPDAPANQRHHGAC
jgi:hypothetical protein